MWSFSFFHSNLLQLWHGLVCVPPWLEEKLLAYVAPTKTLAGLGNSFVRWLREHKDSVEEELNRKEQPVLGMDAVVLSRLEYGKMAGKLSMERFERLADKRPKYFVDTLLKLDEMKSYRVKKFENRSSITVLI